MVKLILKTAKTAALAAVAVKSAQWASEAMDRAKERVKK